MGRQAEAAIRLFAADANSLGDLRLGGDRCEFEVDCRDDRSDPVRCAEIYGELCADPRVALIFGPYSNRLARVAAPIAEDAGKVFINHGGAGSAFHERGHRMAVSVLSPASDYFRGFVRLCSGLKLWRKRIAIVSSKLEFAREVAGGLEAAVNERAARRHGVRIRVKWNGDFDPEATPETLFPALKRNHVNVLASAGSYEHDVAVVRSVVESPLSIPVVGCVAAAVQRFRTDLGEMAEGIVGPSQWEETLDITPELGPRPVEFARRMREAGYEPDYPAAQVYAAGLVTAAALRAAGSLDQARIREAFSDLRSTTLFGDFAIDRVTGRQTGHSMLLIQWHNGRKMIIEPEVHAEQGSIQFPPGVRLLLAGAEMIKLSRRDHTDDDEEDDSNPD